VLILFLISCSSTETKTDMDKINDVVIQDTLGEKISDELIDGMDYLIGNQHANIYLRLEHCNIRNELPIKLLLRRKETYGIMIGKFLTDPVWWFYLFWGAKFLNEKYDVNLKDIGLPFFTIYLVSWGIGIFLGWLSSKFLKMGFSINKGRKLGLLACGLFAVPVIMVPHTGNLWISVGLIALAAGGHCGWSANIFSLMSDIFPKKATATIAGFGGFSGAVGGALVAYAVGKILQETGTNGYTIPFAVAGAGYLLALLIIHLLVPKIKTIEI
jgi:ACS family hexuronate transporter-like MFS transporter